MRYAPNDSRVADYLVAPPARPGLRYLQLLPANRPGIGGPLLVLSGENHGIDLYQNPLGPPGELLFDPPLAHTAWRLTEGGGRLIQQAFVPGILRWMSLADQPAGQYLLCVETDAGGVWLFSIRQG